MKKLRTYNFSEAHQARLLKGLLEQRGIPCLIRNERLLTAMGEIPFVECFPELWVLNDEDYPIARSIADDWQQPPPSEGAEWTCPRCGEAVDGDLGECWNCGCPRDE